MKQLNMSDGKVYFLGSSELVLEKIKCNMYNDFPNILIKTLSPPFKSTFSVNEINDFIEDINKFSPDAVFVGLTAPKQEKLIHEIKKKNQYEINIRCWCGLRFLCRYCNTSITIMD